MSDTPWQGRFIHVVTEGSWEYVARNRDIAAAVILAVDDDDHVLLVEQYRVPLGRRCLELPAGLIGDETEGEPVAVGAARELEEETGYRAGRVEDLGLFHSSPGLTNEAFTLIRARDLTRIGDGGGDAAEDITVHRIPRTAITAFVAEKRREGIAIDAKILLLLASSLFTD